MKKHAPFGSWPSTITAAMVAAKSAKISETSISDGRVYWCENIAAEKGRTAVMMHDGSGNRCILPRPLSAKSKVHEYGGGAYAVDADILYFVLADDQRIYRLDYTAKNAHPQVLTPNDGLHRFADLELDRKHRRLIAVCERHDSATTRVDNFLVAIHLDGSGVTDVLTQGHDFYSNPRISADGSHLCWLTWDHPHMPWDNTALWVAKLTETGLRNCRQVAGNGGESIFQPQWSPDGDLFYVSDRDNWWNLYRLEQTTLRAGKATSYPVFALEAEFATPQWTFGMSTYGFLSPKRLLATYTQDGKWHLIAIDITAEGVKTTPVDTDSSHIQSLSCAAERAVFIGASAHSDNAVYVLENRQIKSLTRTTSAIDKREFSTPRPISFPSSEGGSAKALFYPPQNAAYQCDSERPPLIVICHGGPTGATESSLHLKIQYWTNRGFAVADVNYRGSTGYGRKFRQALFGKWGIYDVDDVCAVVDYLSARGWVDKTRSVIKGSSAGGYTVLAALAFRDTFSAGVSLYGIADLETLARDTHKFEARYLDKLVGPYPEDAATYQRRSPLYYVDKINCPLLIFQGMQDKIVPPEQAQDMFQAVKRKGAPVACVTYANESHGFRDAATIAHMLESELQFYARLFHFTLPSPPEHKLDICNLEE